MKISNDEIRMMNECNIILINNKLNIRHWSLVIISSLINSLFFILLALGIFHLSLPAHASVIPGNELVENAASYDGKTIEFQGEVVGDIMARGKYAWLNVNDGQRAIGVWTEKSLIQNIKKSGSYNYIGDKIKVTGVFHRACSEHGGDLDIHAKKISVVEEGYKIEHTINPVKFAVTISLLIAVLVVIFLPKLLPHR